VCDRSLTQDILKNSFEQGGRSLVVRGCSTKEFRTSISHSPFGRSACAASLSACQETPASS
jgi:hypothetical protein